MSSGSQTNKADVYIAHLYSETPEGYKSLGEDEDIAYVTYLAESGRRKPSLFRRSGERIEAIARLHYPLLVKRFRENFGLVFDTLKKNGLVLKYHILDRQVFDKYVDELAQSREKEFLDKLVGLKNTVDDACKGSRCAYSREQSVENIVVDQVVLNSLKQLLNKTVEYKVGGVDIAPHEIPVDKYIETLNKVVDEITESIGYTTGFLGKLSNILNNWKADISASYGEMVKAIDLKYEVVKKEVDARIEEYSNKMNMELDNVRKRYAGLIEDIDKRINELKTRINELKNEQQRAKEYGREDKEIKKKISESEKELENLESRRRELEDKLNEESNVVRNRYNELINSEKARLTSLLDEKKRLNNELDNLIKQADDLVNKIRDGLLKYIEFIKSVEKNIMDALIPLPSTGEGFYRIPVYVIIYTGKKGERVEFMPPTYLTRPGRIIKGSKALVFENLDKYFENILEYVEDPVYRNRIMDNNLLTKVPLERIEVSLNALADKEFIERKEIPKIIKSVREQIPKK